MAKLKFNEDNSLKKPRNKAQLGGGKRCNRDVRRKARRERAEARQNAYNALSLDEKLFRAIPGSKQHKRLEAQKEYLAKPVEE